jgi:hypothetical protein
MAGPLAMPSVGAEGAWTPPEETRPAVRPVNVAKVPVRTRRPASVPNVSTGQLEPFTTPPQQTVTPTTPAVTPTAAATTTETTPTTPLAETTAATTSSSATTQETTLSVTVTPTPTPVTVDIPALVAEVTG